MTDNQLRYKMLYAQLSQFRGDGLDTDGNALVDGIRRALHEAWAALTVEEKSTFLHPDCQDRHTDGPVDRAFASHANVTKEWAPFRPRTRKYLAD